MDKKTTKTGKPGPYGHLTQDERDQIAVMRGEGMGVRGIARELRRDPGTVSRELDRNAPPVRKGRYLPHRAQERADARPEAGHARRRLKSARCRAYVRGCLKAGWSPETASGRWSALHPDEPISHEAIYQWVYGEAADLKPFLLRAKRGRRPKGRKGAEKTKIPGRVPLSERPREAEGRGRAGHWETDTAVSRRSKAALQVTTGRKTRLARLRRPERRGAAEMAEALVEAPGPVPPRLRRTVTHDNGTENAAHASADARLGTRSFFCEPYHSWEKGTAENTIGLVRRFLPKGTGFATVKDGEIRRIERWLNNRPRKCLNYRTPAEAYRAERVALNG